MANKNYNRKDDRIIGKIIFSADLKNISPILIGKGEGDESDAEVMLWYNGNPYIPASSIAGAIRSFCEKNGIGTGNNEFKKFWGTRETFDEKTYQSHIAFDELLSDNNSEITIRDGVRIDYATSVAADKGKYDYQLVEPGAKFKLQGEVTIRNEMDPVFFKNMVATIAQIITHEEFRIGALTGFGFGNLKMSNWQAYHFDFSDPAKSDGEKWFLYLNKEVHNATGLVGEPFKIDVKNKFEITARFKIKSALITGAYNSDPNAPDKSHLSRREKDAAGNEQTVYLLTAKSVKGAIRHRAVKILNTLGNPESDNILKEMMGWVETEEKGKETKAMKSRLRIEETELKGVKHMPQTRIRIDRFTGGVLSGALFTSEPVWKNDDETFTLHFSIKEYRAREAALLLHLLKDLWTEDLAVGGEKNIGRGILQGLKAEIKWDGQSVNLERTEDGLKIAENEKEFLEKFNKALLPNPNKELAGVQ